jgi:6-phosphogluconolactonase
MVILAILAAASASGAGRGKEYMIYVGTYTATESRGIYAYRFNPMTGETASAGLAVEAVHPSFLAVHPNRKFLYAVNEVSDYSGRNGSISAFAMDLTTGRLKLLNRTSSGGSYPCHLAVHRSGRWLTVANYGSGSVSLLPIQEDGRVGAISMLVVHRGWGADPRRQEGPHAHSVDFSPNGRVLLVCDLGLDKVMIYRLDADEGSLRSNNPPYVALSPGSGPRHLSFHPNSRFVYAVSELKSAISVFHYDRGRGSLREMQTLSALPEGFAGANLAAEIQVHPDGRFAYVSNRGHDSIAVFSIDERKGTLKTVDYVPTRGKTPRYFALDPTGGYLFAANQDSGEVVLFRVDRKTGRLSFTGTVLKVPSPACMLFVPIR